MLLVMKEFVSGKLYRTSPRGHIDFFVSAFDEIKSVNEIYGMIELYGDGRFTTLPPSTPFMFIKEIDNKCCYVLCGNRIGVIPMSEYCIRSIQDK